MGGSAFVKTTADKAGKRRLGSEATADLLRSGTMPQKVFPYPRPQDCGISPTADHLRSVPQPPAAACEAGVLCFLPDQNSGAL